MKILFTKFPLFSTKILPTIIIIVSTFQVSCSTLPAANDVPAIEDPPARDPGPAQYVDVATLETQKYQRYQNQLPECASQQVCNTMFVRRNHTQRLCDCGRNYNWQCSNDVSVHDGHTIELTRRYDKKVYTQVKLCEPLVTVRTCKSPTDWTLLALQSERSGKAHYVVVCRCPETGILEGPYTHNHPPYAKIPGIRVYGMLCSTPRLSRQQNQADISHNTVKDTDFKEYPDFPWDHAYAVLNSTSFANLWK